MTAPRRFLLVGLTGGIATGKSTVAEALRSLGAEVIDADQLAREVVAPGEPALSEIVREFGDVRHADGTLDRRKLGAIVFNDAGRRKRLEAITHPAIRQRFLARLVALEARGFEGLVFFDAPVMIESGNYRNMDRLVVVFTDEATQRGRLMAREGMPAAEASSRMATQMPVIDKAKLADYVIDNTGDRGSTEAQVKRVHEALTAEAAVSKELTTNGSARTIGPLGVVFPIDMGNRGRNEYQPKALLARLVKLSKPEFVACHWRRSGSFVFLDRSVETRAAAAAAVETLIGLRCVTRTFAELWKVKWQVPMSAQRTRGGSVVIPHHDGRAWRIIAVFLNCDVIPRQDPVLTPRVHVLNWASARDVLCAYDRPGEAGDVGVVTRAVLRYVAGRGSVLGTGRAVSIIEDLLANRGLATAPSVT